MNRYFVYLLVISVKYYFLLKKIVSILKYKNITTNIPVDKKRLRRMTLSLFIIVVSG